MIYCLSTIFFHIYATYTGRWAWLSALIGEKNPSQLPLLNLPNQGRITKHFRYCSLWIRFSVPPFLTPEILGDTMLMEEILHLFFYETRWKMEYSPYQLVSRPEILWCSRSWLGKRWFMSTVSWNIIWSSGGEIFHQWFFSQGWKAPLKMDTAGNIIIEVDGSNHFPFSKRVISRFQPLIFQGCKVTFFKGPRGDNQTKEKQLFGMVIFNENISLPNCMWMFFKWVVFKGKV